MARKKKAVIDKLNLKNIKTTAKVDGQSLGYLGKVTVKLQKDGYTVKTISTHNSATLRLLSGMAQLLVGAFSQGDSSKNKDITQYIPQYLGLGYEPSPTATNPATDTCLHKEYSMNRVKLNVGNPVPDSTGRKIIIPYSAVINYAMVNSKKINELGLYSSESSADKTLLARVLVTDDANGPSDGAIQLAVGMNLLVEWNITLQNT